MAACPCRLWIYRGEMGIGRLCRGYRDRLAVDHGNRVGREDHDDRGYPCCRLFQVDYAWIGCRVNRGYRGIHGGGVVLGIECSDVQRHGLVCVLVAVSDGSRWLCDWWSRSSCSGGVV